MKEDVGMSKPKKHVNQKFFAARFACCHCIISFIHKVCSSLKVSLLYIFTIPMLSIVLYNVFNINKFYIHYYKNVFPHKFYY